MAFNNFYFKIALRVVFLTAALALLSYCLVQGLYLRSVYVGVLSVVLMIELIWFIKKFITDLNTFLISILQHDFTLHFKEENRGKDFNELYTSLNKITESFKKLSTEKEIKHRYIATLIEHISIGIVSFDKEGNIHVVNSAFLKLIERPRLAQLNQLKLIDEKLLDTIHELRPGETKVIKFYKNNQLLNLALQASEFKLDDEHFKLISCQNITHELNASEMEAWQKLIRVLTHEIMNSISPIISLSDTLHGVLEKQKEQTELTNLPSWKTLYSGLEAIKIRSEGLHHFTQKYRELTHIPSPDFKEVNLLDFFRHVTNLLQTEINQKGIQLITDIEPIIIALDSKLIEQVIINLIRNAIEAVDNIAEPVIKITASSHESRTSISITDNGSGIEDIHLDKIFIPFFTTKKTGSGIGLALTRQIVVLHKGEIFVQSNKTTGTTFTIVF